mgnify:CR=1 FL=1
MPEVKRLILIEFKPDGTYRIEFKDNDRQFTRRDFNLVTRALHVEFGKYTRLQALNRRAALRKETGNADGKPIIVPG